MTNKCSQVGVVWSRRQLLEQSGMGFGWLAAANLLNRSGLPTATAGETDRSGAFSARRSHARPKAISVIWIVLNGGPSQMDTWDYKPELQRRDGQTFAGADTATGFFKTSGRLMKSPFKFRRHGESETWASEIFPGIARHVDDMAFIHSCHTESNNHSPALFQLNTGLNRMGFPCVGSWVTYGLGTENDDLPAFLVMTDAKGRGLPKGRAMNWGAGFLPSAYQGVRLNNEGPAIDDLLPGQERPANQQRSLLDALESLNRKHYERYQNESDLLARIESFELAFRMQARAPHVLDVEGETEMTRRAYGLDNQKCTHFSRQCLMARRLVEQGVRFVQIYSGGTGNVDSWDAHKSILKNHVTFAAEVDQPISALLTDLKQRGLLDSTLIVCGGEFGRTSDSQGTDTGRDHNPNAFTTWLAGGGTKGGTHFGASDELGYQAVENRTTVHDLHATILHLLGVDHEQLTYRFNGRDYRLTDVYGNVILDIIA